MGVKRQMGLCRSHVVSNFRFCCEGERERESFFRWILLRERERHGWEWKRGRRWTPKPKRSERLKSKGKVMQGISVLPLRSQIQSSQPSLHRHLSHPPTRSPFSYLSFSFPLFQSESNFFMELAPISQL
jgi:hypothetical protein